MPSWKPVLVAGGMFAALVVGMSWGVGAKADSQLEQPRSMQRGSQAHYTVIGTEGTNLIVTDNKTDTLYYYTIDRDAEPGADLKLRGQLDLRQIGQKVLKPKLFLEEMKKTEQAQ